MSAELDRLERLSGLAFRNVSAASIGVFRICFGLAVAIYAIKALYLGEVKGIYVDPVWHFSYWGFSWVKPWPGVGMYLHFIAMAFVAVLVATGVAYRFSSVCLALMFSFVFLCDRTAYLNHMYLITLLCWMMTVLPADRAFSIDALTQSNEPTLPAWCVALVRFHVALPYFFGGVAKLNSDWLQGQPMRMTLSQQPWFPSVGDAVGTEAIVMLFSIGGAVFDLAIVPALLWHRTRTAAFLLCVCFHLTNAFVFPIGVFPWLMIAATTIFYSPDWPLKYFSHRPFVASCSGIQPGRRRLLMAGFAAYAAMHCLLPIRHWVTKGDPSWTERGHFYAWHMMLRGKRCGLRLYATDSKTLQTQVVDLRCLVTPYQYPKVARDPEHIRQLCHYVAKSVPSRDLEVRALALVSLNGRKPELLVDPTIDLTQESATWTHPDWVMSYTNPLLKQHWDVPLLHWEEKLGLNPESLLGLKTPNDSAKAIQAEEQIKAEWTVENKSSLETNRG